MAYLKYRIVWTGSGGGGGGPGITENLFGGATGTPEARAYLIADPPPAFAPSPISLGYLGPAIVDGDYYIDHKDTATASKRIGKVSLISYAAGCFDDGVGYVNPTYELIRNDTNIQFSAGLSPGSGTVEVSINNGVTWKTLNSGIGIGYGTSFTNAELVTAGYTDTLDIILVRRTSLVNIKAVSTVTNNVSYPGHIGKALLHLPGGVGTYVAGNTIKLVNMPAYGTTTTIAAVPGPNDIIINQPYTSGVGAGAQIGTTSAPCVRTVGEEFFIGELSIAPFTAIVTQTNETSSAADDGTITVVISGGSGSFSFAWNDGPTTQNRTGLQAGTYTLDVIDNVTAQEEVFIVIITEPGPEPIPVGTYLDVPKMQSLRFVREAIIDNCSTFQNFDNTLFCKMVFPGVKIRPPFYQKVCKCDLLTIQIHSNFPSHTVELLSQVDSSLVKAFNNAVLKQQLTGLSSFFDMYLTASSGSDPAGTSRVFFNTGTIPIPVSNGDTFEIINNAEGANGTYSIVGISNDVLLGAPYLLISLVYPGADPTSAGRAVFTSNVLNFDIYESILNFQDVTPGLYYMRIRGVNLDASLTEFVSEPIDLRSTHLGTNLLEVRNFDNAGDVVFTTGITVKLRLESKLQKPKPGREDQNYRESNGSPVKLTSKPQRKYALEYYLQPFYRLELLDVLFGFDQIIINKVEYHSDEGTSEPKNHDFYLLANGEVLVEQKQWFQQYNGDDLGSIDPGYIITQFGYIQRT